MKNSLFVLFLFSASVLFAQQTPNGILNKKKSTDDLLLPYKFKHSLNLDFFELKKTTEDSKRLTELLRSTYTQRSKPTNNMPIFEPKGNFFMKIFPVDENIDYKLKIFGLEKPKHY